MAFSAGVGLGSGTTGKLGRAWVGAWVGAWVVHELVHGCMSWWCGGGFVYALLYYLDVGVDGGRSIGELGPGHWEGLGLVMVR